MKIKVIGNTLYADGVPVIHCKTFPEAMSYAKYLIALDASIFD